MVALNAPPDGSALLAAADRAGLLLWIEGGKIEIRGPRSAEPIVRRLAAAKPAVLAALTDRDRPAAPGRPHRWNRPPTPWCAYGHPAGWVSAYGPHVICETCHPSPVPETVVRRVGASAPA